MTDRGQDGIIWIVVKNTHQEVVMIEIQPNYSIILLVIAGMIYGIMTRKKSG